MKIKVKSEPFSGFDGTGKALNLSLYYDSQPALSMHLTCHEHLNVKRFQTDFGFDYIYPL